MTVPALVFKYKGLHHGNGMQILRNEKAWSRVGARGQLLVGMPSEPPDTQLLCLNCFVDGDLPNHAFPVEISKVQKRRHSRRPD